MGDVTPEASHGVDGEVGIWRDVNEFGDEFGRNAGAKRV
jgi:hypothetical protein